MPDKSYAEALAAKDAEMIRRGKEAMAQYPELVTLSDPLIAPGSTAEQREASFQSLIEEMMRIAGRANKDASGG